MGGETLKSVWKKMPNSSNTYYSLEDINRYLSGGMTAQEMHDIERAALSDPFLMDAIDGFRSANKNVTDTHLNYLKASFTISQSEPAKVVPLEKKSKSAVWKMLAAACITVVIGVGWWLMTVSTNHGNKGIAKTDTPHLDSTLNTASVKNTNSAPFPATDSGAAAVVNPANSNDRNTDLAINNRLKKVNKDHLSDVPAKPSNTNKAFIEKEAAMEGASKEAMLNFNTEVSTFSNMPGQAKGMLSSPAMPAQQYRNYNNFDYEAGKNLLKGNVIDEHGNPIPLATIKADGINNAVVSNNDGSFILPLKDSASNVLVSRVGFQNANVHVETGKTNNIILAANDYQLNEVVITSAGKPKSNGVSANFNKFKKSTTGLKMLPYPDEGWSHFYKELGSNLGVDTKTASKTIEIKFTLDENGDPTDFTIVESPDEILTKKAIEFIKKAKWRNFKLSKNAVVRIQFN